MRLQIKRVVCEDVDVDPDDVMSIKAASRILGLSLPGVIAAINRGTLTELVDPEARNPYRDRRFVLRSEVEALLRERGAFKTFEQKWEQAAPAEDSTPLTDEEANAVVHEVRRARRG